MNFFVQMRAFFFLCLLAPSVGFANADAFEKLVFEIGPPQELVKGGQSYGGFDLLNHLEGNFFVIKNPNWPGTNQKKYHGYGYNGGVLRFEGDTVESLLPVQRSLTDRPGRGGGTQPYCSQSHFDENTTNWRQHWRDCGIWARSAYNINGETVFWYHGETNCCYGTGNAQTFFNSGILRSTDGGVTLSTSGTRRLLPILDDPIFQKRIGIDQATVIRKSDYFYMYFGYRNLSGKNKPSVARVNINDDLFDRDNYQKFYNGAWTSLDNNMGSYQKVVDHPNTQSTELGLSPLYHKGESLFFYVSKQSNGIVLSGSEDATTFYGYKDLLVPHFSTQSDSTGITSEWVANASMVPINAGQHVRATDPHFYLFYSYEDAGEEVRSYMYRKVQLTRVSSLPKHNVYSRLVQYNHQTNGDSILSTQWLDDDKYTSNDSGQFGYLFNSTVSTEPLRALFLCQAVGSESTTVRFRNVDSNNPSTDSYTCNTGEFRRGLLGYAYREAGANRIKLVRCVQNGKWIVGLENQCNNGKLLGYSSAKYW